MPCDPEEIKNRRAQERIRPVVYCKTKWCIFRCWLFNDCREVKNDKQE